MKKIGNASGQVLVSLAPNEFRLMANRPHGDVGDGQEIDLSRLRAKFALLEAKQAELTELKNLAGTVIEKLTEIGI